MTTSRLLKRYGSSLLRISCITLLTLSPDRTAALHCNPDPVVSYPCVRGGARPKSSKRVRAVSRLLIGDART
ncbi:hypothetical protein OF83DRAFT_1152729 [Amylostereum chailletii]|nr:hypothetical protein OF83DRAFT_1152729 [Amylostereum chailletii]